MAPAIDLEISGYNRRHSANRAAFPNELRRFANEITAHFGRSPVIYTTEDFRGEYLAGTVIERLWFPSFVFRPRSEWVFWQFSPRGRIPGIHGFTDLNVFNGDAEAFNVFVYGTQ